MPPAPAASDGPGEAPGPAARALHGDAGEAEAPEAVVSPTPPLPETGGTPPGSAARALRGDAGEAAASEADTPREVAPGLRAGELAPREATAVVSPAPPLPETGESAVAGAAPAPAGADGAGVSASPARAPRGTGEPGGHDGGAAPGSRDGAGEDTASGGDGRFTVRLANFEGPFDLLLQLIAKHKLDVTEVALSKVTDEFMSHIRAMGADWDLDQTTEFLVVAATLLDLKAARLLPAAEVEDEADLALLEARDLLFARLLQYRAYKQIAEIFDRRLDDEARRFPRTVGLEPQHAELLPDVVISIGAEGFAKLAVKAMQPKPRPQVYVDHIHAPLVSVREQAELVIGMLRERGRATFRELTEGVDDTLTVVARFLALLELYREKALVLDQEEALGELTVTWAAGDQAAAVTVTDEFDQVVEEKQ
ncbi:segregation/condensation protein A [Streptomyces sp. NPDC015127]|uniref:segregation and condensation protein A n=1 Tax=Streptomyces sp. NPDC015127 TaxID=3364939 RepID=UPI0036FABB43